MNESNLSKLAGGVTNPLLGNTLKGYLDSDQSASGVSLVLSNLISLAIIIGILYFTYQLLMGGINWIMSRGDKVNVENARNRLTHAILGITILFATFAVLAVVESFFGINIMNIDVTKLYIL